METAFYLFSAACVLYCISKFLLHVRLYGRAVESLASRGMEVEGFKPSFLSYGQNGCMDSIKILRDEQAGNLNHRETALLEQSVRAYRAQLVILIPCFLLILYAAYELIT